MKPLVTVVIPTYNYGNIVERAIRSVMEQTLNNIECFIVDDGSTDDTRHVVESVIEGDLRFHYLYQENRGVAFARNLGVFSGTAPFVCCLDADDRIQPQFLETCVKALLADPSLGIAYTGLWYVKPDGEEGLSPWPDQYNYDRFLSGQNQIPTCNVARRRVWERLGGQRQRYAPQGAGEEDAEMWLRAGAYGWNALKVTDAGLFVYSWLSGRVSGDKKHRITDYRSWHPWTKDNQHPFASMAKPVSHSHPVRQYDEPFVSVIIPIGPNHIYDVIAALDSLDAQTYRYWEAIVVDDTGDSPSPKLQQMLTTVYPHVRLIVPHKRGAGAARNAGVDAARSNLLLFLDADDWLYPEAIQSMLDARFLSAKDDSHPIIYTDYVGKAFIDDKMAASLGDRLLWRDPNDGQAVIAHKAFDYDCERAQRQPQLPPYVWNLITSLVPKEYHYEIGGFDESMSSWEDWDYWVRMAMKGKCFHHLEEPLVVYRFYTGTRRDVGLHESGTLLEYLKRKYEATETMGCNCKGRKNSPSIGPFSQLNPVLNPALAAQAERTMTMSDDSWLLCVYNHPNRGGHRAIGDAVFVQRIGGINMVPVSGGGFRIDYGYRSGGERFLVHKEDIRLRPEVYNVYEQRPAQEAPAVPKTVTPPPPPPIHGLKIEFATVPEEKFKMSELIGDDLGVLPGVTSAILTEFQASGIITYADVLEAGIEGLTQIKGIGTAKAQSIIDYLNQRE